MLKAWLELARISNLPTAWTNVLAGWLLAGGELRDQRLLWLLLGGSLLYCGGMILNDAADAGWDRIHRKERPIPRGSVSAGAVWLVGVACLAFGSLACVRGHSNLWLTIALVAVIIAYDVYHKPWAGSVVMMGLCRTFLYLVAGWPAFHAAYAARHPWLGEGYLNDGARLPMDRLMMFPAPLMNEGRLLLSASLLIGAYIVGLTMIARMEGRGTKPNQGAVWLGTALLWSPGVVGVASIFTGDSLLALIFVAMFAILISVTSRMMRRGGAEIGRAVGWLLAGIALVDALAVARVSFGLACVFAACVPLLRLWQRKIAAT